MNSSKIKYYILHKDKWNKIIYKDEDTKLYFYNTYFESRSKWLGVSPEHAKMVRDNLTPITEEDAFLYIIENP